MNIPTIHPDDDPTIRLIDTRAVQQLPGPVRRWLDVCLRRWGGVGLDEATVGDMRRANRAVGADMAERSPDAAAAMAGRTGYTATDVLHALRDRRAP